MDQPDIDWNEIQNEYDNEILSKIYKFTANEFSSYNSDFPELFNLKETVQKQWDTFINQFSSYVPVFEPHFYSDKIQDDFNREISTKTFSNLVNFYKKLIERTKWRNKKVSARLNSEYAYPKYSNEFNAYVKSSSYFLETCTQAIFSLQTPETEAKYIELALRYEFLKYNENFAITNLYQIYKHFPLIRRREILTIASNRFISDSENELNGNFLPKLIKDTNSLISELKRLSDHMKVKFDIESHDGQFFCYLCEKLYIQCSSMPFTIENTTDDIPVVSDPTFIDRLNHDFMNEINIDPGIKASYDILISPSDKQLTKLMEKFDNKVLKILTIDKVTALLRLQFSRNKTLFQSIIQSLHQISDLRDEILKLNETEEQEKEKEKQKEEEKEKERQKEEIAKAEAQIQMQVRSPDQVANMENPDFPESKILSEEELNRLNQKKGRSVKKSLVKKEKKKEPEVKKELNFFEMQYSIFRKEILAAASMAKSSTTEILDDESLLEAFLDLFDQYYKQKLLVIHSLIEINRNLPPLYLIEDNIPSNFKFDVQGVAFKFIELRPTFLTGVHNSCLTPFRLSLDTLEKMSTSLRTMINYQIFSHNYFMNTHKDLYPFFEFLGLKTPYQSTKEEFPYSFTDFFYCLSKIPDFVALSFRISSEMCTSLSVRALKFESYFLYATWEQLFVEMKQLFNTFEPESFKFNMQMSNSVSQIMTSRYLTDLRFIHEQIEKQDKDKQFAFATKIREMFNLANMLRSYLIQTDSILPTFKRQANEIAHTDIKDVIDLAYGDYDFSTISDEWQPDELIKIVQCQKTFYLSLLVAVRYNNFADDSLFINRFFEIESHGTGFTSRPTKAMLQRQRILRSLPSMLFYEPNQFKRENFQSLFCDISHITKEVVSNTEVIAEYYMPFCLKSEIAFILGYERNFLKHYSSTDVFELEPTSEVNSILTKDNKLNLFYSPMHYQCLSIQNNSINDLHQVLRFASIRLQMNEWIRHDAHIMQTKAKTLENIYSENLLFTSPIFSRMNIEINKNPQAREIDFSVHYFEIERLTYVCKHFLTALNIYESTMMPETKESTFITSTSAPAAHYTIESVKSYIGDIANPPKGRPTFLTPSLYIQKCMNQFWHQCSDQFRNEFMTATSFIEKQIDDAIIGLDESKHSFNAYSFALQWLRLECMKLGYYLLIETRDPSKVTPRKALVNLTKESYTKGKEAYEQNVNIKSTARIGGRPKIGTIETALLEVRTSTLLEEMQKMFNDEMKRLFIERYEREISLIDAAFSAPNQALKPDCYAKVMKINSVHTNYLPTISSIEEQFTQELGYAQSRFCHAVYRMIVLSSKKTEGEGKNMVKIELKDIDDEVKSISEMLKGFLVAGKKQLLKTWFGYLSNNLREYNSHSELQIFLNMYVKLFKSNYENTISFKLATKLTELLNTLAHLRDEERFAIHDQVRFERRVTKEIRNEFDVLVNDLAEEIKKAKQKFVDKKKQIYNHAFTAIDRFKENPEFINDTTSKNPKYSIELLNAPIELRDPDRRTLVKVQVQQRKLKREQRRKLRKLHEENRRLKREAKLKKQEKKQAAKITATQPTTETTDTDTNENEENKEIKPTEPTTTPTTTANDNNNNNVENQVNEEEEDEIKDVNPKMNENEVNENENENEESNEDDDTNESYSSASSNSEDDEFDDEGRKRRKEKNIPLEMEKIRAEIEQLKIERKKLRVANSLSNIGFINIYTRMINKVAEEKKGYSAKLLHNQRIAEEEMVKITDELRGAYNMLTSVEIDIETLKADIDAVKQKNAKLLHWRELNLRKSGEIQKELKILTTESSNSGNVNVTKLLKKISEKQDELEMLNYENEKLNEDIYYEVREPMAQLDMMRREITKRRAQHAEMIQQQQYELQQQLELQEQQELDEKIDDQNEEEMKTDSSSKVHFTLPKSPRSGRSPRLNLSTNVSQNEIEQNENEVDKQEKMAEEEEEEDFDAMSELSNSMSLSQRGLNITQQVLVENELLKRENESFKKQIKEIEDRINSAQNSSPPNKQTLPFSARPRSTGQSKKTIVRPGVIRALIGGASGSRPKTSRL